MPGDAREVESPSRRIEDAPTKEVEAEAIYAERWMVSMKPGHCFSRTAADATSLPSSCWGSPVVHAVPKHR